MPATAIRFRTFRQTQVSRRTRLLDMPLVSNASSCGKCWLGTCFNPQSPRAGLLTFQEQGCQDFEKDQEPTSDESRRNRVDFKDSIENLVREALGAFTRSEVAKVNDPDGRLQNWIDHWECKVSEILELQLFLLFIDADYGGDFDRGNAAGEMILETKRHSKRFWEVAQRGFASLEKRDTSAIRLPDTHRLEDEFWSKVQLAVAGALAHKGERS
jgi:hypothetical protein